MKLKQKTVNAIQSLERPFSIEGVSKTVGKSYLTARKYIYVLEQKNIIRRVGFYSTGDRGRPVPLFANVRVKGKFVSHKNKEPIL